MLRTTCSQGFNAIKRPAQVIQAQAMPGDGLGLAIMQELAALYGGQLQLQRAALGGLAALLELPAAAALPHPQPRTP